MQLKIEDLFQFLSGNLGVDTSKINSSTLLISTGIIDSLDAASLVGFIESKCGVQVDPDDVNLENLDNLERMLKFAAAISKSDKK
jgi:acyl carrier protein